MEIPQIRGIVTPIITPFDAQGHIDPDAVGQLVDYLLEKGIRNLMVAGSTGEGLLLTAEERKLLFDVVIKQAAGKANVLAHTGCIDTSTTLELTRYAQEAGANCASIIAPFFYTYDDESLLRHFTTVTNAVPDFPIMLYAFPGNAKNDITPGLLARLLQEAPNIFGLKSSNSDVARFADYIEVGGPNFVACFGVDELMLQGLLTGSHAQVSGNSNVCPEAMIATYDAYQSGDVELAKEKFAFTLNIMRAIHFGQPLSYYKEAVSLRGIPAGPVRSPQRPLTPEERNNLQAQLRVYGLIS